MTSGSIRALRASLVDRGYRPLAVYHHLADCNCPGKQPFGPKWQDRARAEIPGCLTEDFHPAATNTGILCDGLRVFDFDVEPEELIIQLAELGDTILGAAPIRMRHNSNRFLVVTRAAAGEPRKVSISGELGKVEVLGWGQQFVAYGTHTSGAELFWDQELFETDCNALPVVTEEQVRDFLTAAAAIIKARPPKTTAEPVIIAPRERPAETLDTDWSFEHPRVQEFEAYYMGLGPGSQRYYAIYSVMCSVAKSALGWGYDLTECELAGYAGELMSANHGKSIRKDLMGDAADALNWAAAQVEFGRYLPKQYPNTLNPNPNWETEDDIIAEALADHAKKRNKTTSIDSDSDSVQPSRQQAANEEPSIREPSVEPLDIFGTLTPEPLLSRHMLPKVIADFAFDTAERMGADPAAVVMSALTVCAAAIDDRVKIQPRRNNTSFLESARMWTAIIGPPGSRKTPAANEAKRPLAKVEQRWVEQDIEPFRQYDLAMMAYEQKLAKYKSEIRNGKDAEPPNEPEKPPLRQIMVNDMTMEAGVDVIAENPRGVLIFQDELMALLGMMDTYHKGGASKDRPILLQLWNGGPFTVNRKGRRTMVPNLSGCFLGGIQPDKLLEQARSLRSDGLLQRFHPIPVKSGFQEVDRAPDMLAIQSYDDLVNNLSNLTADAGYAAQPVTLSEAAHAYRCEVEEIAKALTTMPCLSPALQQHADKMPSLFARLLLTLHVIDCYRPEFFASFKIVPKVSGETAKRARDLMVNFLIPHAVRVYGDYFSADQVGDDAQWIAGYILSKGLDEVTERILRRSQKPFEKDHKRYQQAMKVLVEAGWLCTVEKRWEVNPAYIPDMPKSPNRNGNAEKLLKLILRRRIAL